MPSDTAGLSQHQVSHAPQHHRALAIPEIVENILVHLPIKDLFVHQRVCRGFKEVIEASTRIQKKMLRVPPDTPPEPWTVIRRRGKWAFECIDPSEWNGCGPTTIPVTLNPTLNVLCSKPEEMFCIRRTRWGKSWRNEHVRLNVRAFSVNQFSSLLATYISDPPCKEAVVRVKFYIVWPRSTTRPEAHPYSASSESKTVHSLTGLTLGNLWENALDGPGEFVVKDQYGTGRSQGEPNLKALLERLGNPVIVLDMPWEFELVKVVVPVPEEWAEVTQRSAGR